MASRRSTSPEWFHGSVALALSLGLALLLLVIVRPSTSWNWAHYLGLWLAGVNLTAFGYYWHDKQQARKTRNRVPEIVLHGLAIAGGSLGAYAGMRLFRHKTIKGSFQIVFWTIVVMQTILVVAIFYRLYRHGAG